MPHWENHNYCTLRSDPSVVYTADINTSREHQEPETATMTVWECVDLHGLALTFMYLFFLLQFFCLLLQHLNISHLFSQHRRAFSSLFGVITSVLWFPQKSFVIAGIVKERWAETNNTISVSIYCSFYLWNAFVFELCVGCLVPEGITHVQLCRLKGITLLWYHH